MVLFFYCMIAAESEESVARLLLERFHPDEMKNLNIVYDNCCHLARYCLARFPTFFRGVAWYIDRLHWYNHSACQRTMNLNDLKGRSAAKHLIDLNSQACEQVNNELGRVRGMAAHMHLQNAVPFLKEFFWRLGFLRSRVFDVGHNVTLRHDDTPPATADEHSCARVCFRRGPRGAALNKCEPSHTTK
jgi:hypothetical protein